MFYVVIAVTLGLIFFGSLAFGLFVEKAGLVVTAVAAVLLILVTLLFSATTVSPRSVAINTSFGKYAETLPNGFHMTAPWSQTEEFSTLLNNTDFRDKSAIPVNLVGGGRGAADLTVQWKISDSNGGAERLWKEYKTFDSVEEKLIDNNVRTVTRETLGSYEPKDAVAGENLAKINTSLHDTLQAKVSDYGVVIQQVSVTNVSLDGGTQAALNRIVEANANITRAKAEQERARIDAATAKLREQQGALSPAANQRYCLEVANSWDASKNGPLPAGFSCLGGSSPFVVTGK